jgi:hypothetical protein
MKRLIIICALLLLPVTAFARGSSGGGHAPSSRGASGPSIRSSGPASRSTSNSTNFSAPRTINSNFRPSFSGYTPPIGSRVYSPGFSFTDFLIFSYLFSHTGNQQVIVQQPDGHKVTTQSDSVDVMYYVDFAILLLLGFGLIGLIVWYVNKKTQPSNFDKGTHYATY